MRIVALIGVLAAAPACSDECRDGESICDGTHIRACGPPGDFGGVRAFNSLEDGCGDAMCLDLTADGNRVALCSSSGQPDPRCDGQVGGFCYDAQTKLYCDLGYSHELRCEGACVRDDQKHILFCSIEPKPNLICDDTDPVACDGQSVVSCVDHYVVDQIACPASCVGTNNRAYCTDGSTCSAGDQATCDDPNDPVGAIHGCIAGQGVAMSCNSSSQCENDAVVVGETVGATEAECVHRDP